MGSLSKTDIANMAIRHLNVSKEIADFANEASQEAKACRRFYDPARRQVLRDFGWPFATSIVALNLVASQPNQEWRYSYRYPSDCLMFRRILSGRRNDSRQSRVPYRVAADSQGQLIFTDQVSAQGEYTLDVTNEAFFDPSFAMALSFRLANLIAPSLTAGDPYKLGQRAQENYMLEISRAQANAANEEQPDQPVESEFVRARNGDSHGTCGEPWSALPGSNFIE